MHFNKKLFIETLTLTPTRTSTKKIQQHHVDQPHRHMYVQPPTEPPILHKDGYLHSTYYCTRQMLYGSYPQGSALHRLRRIRYCALSGECMPIPAVEGNIPNDNTNIKHTEQLQHSIFDFLLQAHAAFSRTAPPDWTVTSTTITVLPLFT